MSAAELAAGLRSGDRVAVARTPAGVALAAESGATAWLPAREAGAGLVAIDQASRPRWVWWDAAQVIDGSIADAPGGDTWRPHRAWDVAAAHRLLAGGLAAGPADVWAGVHGLDASAAPREGQLDLFDPATGAGTGGAATGGSAEGVPDDPIRPDGHLRPDWVSGGWASDPVRASRWAGLALEVATAQAASLPTDQHMTVYAESAAAVIAVELGRTGLPIDRVATERLLTSLIGARPNDAAEARRARADRDECVLRHLPAGIDPDTVDLRNPAQVRGALRRLGVDVPDTRSWRLEAYAGEHPFVAELLQWRKAERIATTYGYGWLDAHVGPDDRLRGAWTASDGGAGRMTAQAGLHNLPAELRPAVAAEPGHVLVRADLGQVEPRVLAAVSGDRALAAATTDDDLYLPVAERLGCPRATAKIAVLAAMYGQTSGPAGQALEAMRQAYPVAMRYLRSGEEAGRTGRLVRTYGGRAIRSRAIEPPGVGASDAARAAYRSAVAAQGRYVRNALVQGAAAELFKAWVAAVRAALLDATGPVNRAEIVLCLHDELVVHAPVAVGPEVAALVTATLADTAALWFAQDPPVRFVADVTVVARWSDAKPG